MQGGGGIADFSYPTSKLRRGRVQGGGNVSPTITTSCGVCKIMSKEQMTFIDNDGNKRIKTKYVKQMKQDNFENAVEYAISENPPKVEDYLYKDFGVFKLTPRECGRLMGVKDSDIDKMFAVYSHSQCYKQFGNSIVVPVLMAIFSQLNIDGVTPWNEMNQEERETLIETTTR